MKIGVTFDYEQCTNLGLDWKEVLNYTVKFGIPIVRIGLKWSKIETEKGKFNWSVYDEILQFLERNNTKVILCLGMKSPRWPEFFIPEWLGFKGYKGFKVQNNNDILRQRLFLFLEKAIKRYLEFKSISTIQLENEPLLKSGPQKGRIDQLFLIEEFSYLKTLTNLKIILNAQALPTTGIIAEYLKGRNEYKKKLIEICDAFGMNIYERFEGKTLGGFKKTFRAGKFVWRYLKSLINHANIYKKEIVVTELQAEPWQFGEVDLKDAYANRTCNPKMVLQNIQRVKNLGIETILLWGFEFHIACKMMGNDEWVKLLYKN